MFLRQYTLTIAWIVIDEYKSNITYWGGGGGDNVSQTIYTGYCLDGNRYIQVKYYNWADNVSQTIYTGYCLNGIRYIQVKYYILHEEIMFLRQYILAIAWMVIDIYESNITTVGIMFFRQYIHIHLLLHER